MKAAEPDRRVLAGFVPSVFRRFTVGTNVVISAALLIIAVSAGLLPAATNFQLYGAPIPLFIAAAALCGFLFFISEAEVGPRVRRAYPFIVAAALVLNFGILVAVAYGLASVGYTWDSQLVFDQAVNYATNGAIDDDFIAYVIASPNNIGLLALLGGLFKAAQSIGITHYLTVALALNVGVLFVSEVLTFLVAKMLYGKRLALIALGFCTVFISMSMYVPIAYTDTLTIGFPILILYLSLLVIRLHALAVRLLLAVAIGLLTIVGYYLKPTVVIATIAVAIVLLLALLTRSYAVGVTRKGGRHLLTLMACLVCAVAGAAGGYVAVNAYVDELAIIPYPFRSANENSYPLTHFLNIGMKYRVYDGIPYYGGFNNDTAVTVTNLPTKRAKTDFSVAQIREQLADYGPIGYLRFLALKAHWILSDATFYAFGEGSNANVTFMHRDGFSRWLQGFMYIGGAWYILFGNILQVFWIALLILIGAQFIVLLYSKASRESLYGLLPRLMVAGIIVFLLFFEGRSRYLFLYLPVFIICAVYILNWYRRIGGGVTDVATPLRSAPPSSRTPASAR